MLSRVLNPKDPDSLLARPTRLVLGPGQLETHAAPNGPAETSRWIVAHDELLNCPYLRFELLAGKPGSWRRACAVRPMVCVANPTYTLLREWNCSLAGYSGRFFSRLIRLISLLLREFYRFLC